MMTWRDQAMTCAAILLAAMSCVCLGQSAPQSSSSATAPVSPPAQPAVNPAPSGGAGQFQVHAALSGTQITGIAVLRDGRTFVNSPTWHDEHAWHVAVLGAGKAPTPYPPGDGGRWNSWKMGQPLPEDRDVFICVQSVVTDRAQRLWALDAASPKLQGVQRKGGGPKLVCIDPFTDEVVQVIRFDASVAPDNGYLNDVRIESLDVVAEARRNNEVVGRAIRPGPIPNYAYITDSGAGAIIVVNLTDGTARRVLDDHPSTSAEADVVPVIGGRELRDRATGAVPQIHADGIALDIPSGYLYWQALTGRTLYRIPTAALRDPTLDDAALARAVETLGPSVLTDGMEADRAGNLYFTALERDAIVVRTPDGVYHELFRDERLAWPDSIAMTYGDGRTATLYATTSQIHRTAAFSADGSMPTTPYLIVRGLPWANAASDRPLAPARIPARVAPGEPELPGPR